MPRAATSGQRGVVLLGDPDGMPTSQVYLGDPDLGGLTAGPQLEGDVGDISWIGDRFVAQATHFESETYSTNALFSTDGTLWDEHPLWEDRSIDEHDLVAVGSLDGRYVAVVTADATPIAGSNVSDGPPPAYILVSDDGTTWFRQEITPPES